MGGGLSFYGMNLALPDIPELQHNIAKNFLDLLFLDTLYLKGNDS